jgi:virginiamycin B lyase
MRKATRAIAVLAGVVALAASGWAPGSAQEPGYLLEGKVREWAVPVEDSRPHDPAADPRGNIWLTLQRSNHLARLNPETGEWKLFTLPTPHSGPHGLVSDAAGNIWYTANAAGKIGRVDAKTGEITEYPIRRNSGGLDPHTPIIGPDGYLWFTAQRANLIVKMDMQTGQMREFAVATPNARPYGIVAGPDRMLWVVLFGTNRIAKVDPATGKITEYEIPFPDARPRRLWALSRPIPAIYYTDFRRGTLARFDIERASFKEWPSPSGLASQPYGIAADGDGVLWYNEFSANQLVRFDPRTETFRRFTLPSAKSEVRHMDRDPKGRVWMALSGCNKVAVVE